MPLPLVGTPKQPELGSASATALMVWIAAAVVFGRLLSVSGPIGDNDASRWMTVRALVEHQTYSVGKRTTLAGGTYRDEGLVREKGWWTGDLVLNPTTQLFYSSKPPLLPTLVAAEYWALSTFLGWTFQTHPGAIVRTVLLTFNGLPFVAFLFILRRRLQQMTTSVDVQIFALACASFGSFIPTFLTVLNNHCLGAFACLFALDALLSIWNEGGLRRRNFLAAGFFAGCAASQELPATCFALALMFLLALKDSRRTLMFFAPMCALWAGAFVLSNLAAMDEWLPAYEKGGTEWYHYPGSYWAEPRGIDLGEPRPLWYAWHFILGHHGFFSLTPWLLMVLPHLSTPWLPRRHAGSLLPLLVLLLLLVSSVLAAGLAKSAGLPLPVALLPAAAVFVSCMVLPWGWWRGMQRDEAMPRLTLACSVLVVAFYLAKTANYGGTTAGPRWLLWLYPMWLLPLASLQDGWTASVATRRAGGLLLAIAVGSVAYAIHPWQHPWPYALLR